MEHIPVKLVQLIIKGVKIAPVVGYRVPAHRCASHAHRVIGQFAIQTLVNKHAHSIFQQMHLVQEMHVQLKSVIVQLIVHTLGYHGLKLEERHLERHLELVQLLVELELEVPLVAEVPLAVEVPLVLLLLELEQQVEVVVLLLVELELELEVPLPADLELRPVAGVVVHLEHHLDLELPAERELEVPLAVGPLFNGRFP